jgi:hypothetical protein
MRIKVTSNIPEIERYMASVEPSLKKAAEDTPLELGRFIVRSAKMRVPRWTGLLARSIDFKRPTKQSIEVGIYGVAARYGILQEEGFTPHWIPAEYIEQHVSNPGTRGIDTRNKGGAAGTVGSPRAWVMSRRKAAPFMEPAIQAGIAKLPELAERAITKEKRR